MKHFFEVENIKCGGCVNSIKTALLKLDNVEDIIIDKDVDSVTVVGNIERSILIKKLNELGYPEKGNNTLIKTAKSYVSCAMGRMSE
ncbi:MAG: heavy-metal-associated domain-containing protein [Flavobacteriaceae bacterium]|jgi:copper chaperone|nr:heavy-metal-associated domain-containing protein [Flavobacteriaceae bacterium]